MLQEWVNDRLVVLGTKCNTLLLLDVVTSKVQEVPLPRVGRQQRTPLGQAVQQSSSGGPADGQTSPRGPAPSCGIHAMSMSPDGCMLATGGANANDCQVFSVVNTPGTEPGIRLAPCQTLVVSAAGIALKCFRPCLRLLMGWREALMLRRAMQTGCSASAGSPPATSSQVGA